MKHFWASKTLWVNGLAIVALVFQAATGREWLDAELQLAILALVNLVLRKITSEPIGW